MWAVVAALGNDVLTREQQVIVDYLRDKNLRYYNFLPEEAEIFSKMQRAVVILRYNNIPYRTIEVLFQLSGSQLVTTILRLTAMGFRWEKSHMTGGSYPMLPDTFFVSLKTEINERTHGLNCMRTSEAKQMINEKAERINKRTIIRLIQ